MSVERCPAAAVQAAVYDRILADHPTFTVYRYDPESNQPYPRTVFGRISGQLDDTKTSRGARVTIPIEVCSQSPSLTELVQIMDGILDSLTDSADELEVAGNWCVILVEAPWSVETLAGDQKGVIQRGEILLTVWVEDAS